MTISRRKFMEVSIVTTLPAIAQAEDCLSPEGKTESPSIYEVWKKHYHPHPKILGGEYFRGYKPRLVSRPDALVLKHLFESVSLHEMIRNPNRFVVTEVTQRNYCDGTFKLLIDSVDAPAKYNPSVRVLMAAFADTIKKTRNLKYEDVVHNAILAALNSFRDVEYKLSGMNDLARHNKTMTQLIHDGEGLCTDFALSRYMLASALGVKSEHLMLVLYAPKIPWVTGAVGHANVAIFHPKFNEWLIVDGTGRNPAIEKLGYTVAYQNDSRNEDAVERMVPTVCITSRGIFELDSIRNVRHEEGRLYYDVLPTHTHTKHKLPVVAERHAELLSEPQNKPLAVQQLAI